MSLQLASVVDRRTPTFLIISKDHRERTTDLRDHVLSNKTCTTSHISSLDERRWSYVPRPCLANARREAVRVTIEPPTAASRGMRDAGIDPSLQLCVNTSTKATSN